jgi:hypothetical protein
VLEKFGIPTSFISFVKITFLRGRSFGEHQWCSIHALLFNEVFSKDVQLFHTSFTLVGEAIKEVIK